MYTNNNSGYYICFCGFSQDEDAAYLGKVCYHIPCRQRLAVDDGEMMIGLEQAIRELIMNRALRRQGVRTVATAVATAAVAWFAEHPDAQLVIEQHKNWPNPTIVVAGIKYPLPSLHGRLPVTITAMRIFDSGGDYWVRQQEE